MSLNTEFKENPKAFLEKYVVVVKEDEQNEGNAKNRVAKFTLKQVADKKTATLTFHTGQDDDFISAYWLPWQTKEAPSMQLGEEAKFFFTSEMTNCRFSVLVNDLKKPTVSHIAGTLSPPQRTKKEGEVLAGEAKDKRRLSVSGGRGKYNRGVLVAGTQIHQYRGTGTGRPAEDSSVFVWGETSAEGNWKFTAQITAGDMSTSTLTEDLQCLGFVDI